MSMTLADTLFKIAEKFEPHLKRALDLWERQIQLDEKIVVEDLKIKKDCKSCLYYTVNSAAFPCNCCVDNAHFAPK